MRLDGLDPVIHAPKRLAIMSLLCSSADADFTFLRDQLVVSESDLSKQMKTLAESNYVKIHKNGAGRGSVTRYSATRAGRKALTQHVEALRSILEPTTGDPSDLDDS